MVVAVESGVVGAQEPTGSLITGISWETYIDDEWRYTITYPHDWTVRVVFTNGQDRPLHIIRKRVRFSDPNHAEIDIDVWQKTPESDLITWLVRNQRRMLELGNVHIPSTANAVIDGQASIVLAQVGTCSAPPLFFAYIPARDRMFAIYYSAADGGEALDIYRQMVVSFTNSAGRVQAGATMHIPELLYPQAPRRDCYLRYSANCCGYTAQSAKWACGTEVGTNIDYGNCVWWAAYNRPDVGDAIPRANAGQWAELAEQAGFPVDTTPQVGDIVVNEGDPGHVAYVTNVGATTVRVTSMGYCRIPPPCFETATYPIAGHRFIHRKGGTNLPPIADAGGPYTANEGETVILDASGSSDPDGMIVSFEWDLDGDGEYDDATGQTPSWTWPDDYAGSIGLKVTDDDGDIGTDTTTVTISNVAPTVDAGPDQTVFRYDVVALSGAWTDPAGSLDELYSWTWDVTGDGITDNSGSASYGSVVPASTSFATEGTYTLTFAVTDKDSGAGSDSIVVEVLNRPPDCSAAAPSIETIWPPNHKFVLVNVLGVTDPEGDLVSITIDRIRQDEPVDTVGDGRFSPDGQGVGTDTAHVRAERIGTKKAPGNGRVYHIGFTADDGHGGSCSSEVLVEVPHDQRGTPPVDDGALYDSTALAP